MKIIEGHDLSECLVALAEEVVLIIERRKDDVRLIEIWSDGFTTDTWYPTVEIAQQRAVQWWSPKLSAWSTVPAEVRDPITFAHQWTP